MSPIHWLLVIGIAVLLFGGRGKLSGVMGDFAKGIKAFKSGMKDEEETPAPVTQVAPPQPAAAPTATATVHAVGERPRERA
ncbi:MAG TPA: twin-arginine translocase TatA/TatE family subunit [Stellaceae bacterium]|nr:twin-arginine translocase TatA/TatE family subunit [Stellaceae bacterium]